MAASATQPPAELHIAYLSQLIERVIADPEARIRAKLELRQLDGSRD